jgi:CO/xanthine dehydrogenase Mo-binding subunit
MSPRSPLGAALIGFSAALEQAARAPGEVVRNQGDVAAAGRDRAHRQRPLRGVGGGFGRKSKPDYAVEAAPLSQAMNGAPVKLTGTREDDIQHGYYHTVSVEHLEAGLDANGKPVAWLHRSVAPSIGSIFGPDPQHEQPFERGMGPTNVLFVISNLRVENPAAPAHARIGWYRSVSNIPHAFAIQSFVAELAAAAGRDPKDYLLELIGRTGASIRARWAIRGTTPNRRSSWPRSFRSR